MVDLIIDGALHACTLLEMNFNFEMAIISQLSKTDKNDFFPTQTGNDYQKSRIFFCLRGILLCGQEGHRRNQEVLMNAIQNSKYRNLIFNGKFEYKDKLNNFNLNST